MTTETADRTKEPTVESPARHWWSWPFVIARTQRTGICPFCGAELPRVKIHWGAYDASGIWVSNSSPGYAVTCPKCGNLNVPDGLVMGFLYGLLSLIVAIPVGILVLGMDALLLFLLFLVLGTLLMAGYGLLARKYIGALVLAGLVVWVAVLFVPPIAARSTWPPHLLAGLSLGEHSGTSYSANVRASIPLKEHTGHPVNATIVIHNTGTRIPDVLVNVDPLSAANIQNPGVTVARWVLDGVSVDNEPGRRDLGTLPRGATRRVVLRLTPREGGKQELDADIDSLGARGAITQTLSKVAIDAQIAGNDLPAPHFGVSTAAILPELQTLKHPARLLLTIRGTGLPISDLRMNLHGVQTATTGPYSRLSGANWGVHMVTVNGRQLSPRGYHDFPENISIHDLINDTPTPNLFYKFGPLKRGQVLHVAVQLIPWNTGTSRLQLRIYRGAVDSETRMRTVKLSASVSR